MLLVLDPIKAKSKKKADVKFWIIEYSISRICGRRG